MAIPRNLRNSISDRLLDTHTEVLLAAIGRAIVDSNDEDVQDALSVLRVDVKSYVNEKKDEK